MFRLAVTVRIHDRLGHGHLCQKMAGVKAGDELSQFVPASLHVFSKVVACLQLRIQRLAPLQRRDEVRGQRFVHLFPAPLPCSASLAHGQTLCRVLRTS